MLELEQAVEQILRRIDRLPAETVPLGEASGRILSQTVLAACDLPAFDNSAMDGYAVRAEDVAGAAPQRPVALQLIGEVAAGETLLKPILPGTCARIFTGSPLPAGANAVVMQEDTESQHPQTVLVKDKVRPFENVRLRGEEIKKGAEILKAGTKIDAGKVGLMGAAGVGQLRVSKRPVVTVVATGSELLEPGSSSLAPGKIFESNRYMLASVLAAAGALPRLQPLVPDSAAATRAALEEAFSAADAVITSGGVSVGEYDFVKSAFEGLGGKLDFWKVAVKPGKPFVFGQLQEKLFFGLPGNPVSSFVTFLLLVRPALLRWQGARDIQLPRYSGVLQEDLTNRAERRHFMSVRVSENGEVRSAGLQASHAIVALGNADGLVEVPPGRTLRQGSVVTVLRW